MKDLVVNERIAIPLSEIQLGFVRSGGPGGQNVNKVATKVELRWRPADSAVLDQLGEGERRWLLRRLQPRLTAAGELLVTSSRTREQTKNRADAMAKLVAIVRSALARPKARRPTRPSRAARERRLADKRRRSERKRGRREPSAE